MKKKKKLTFYVHDLFYEVGHSNVTLYSLLNLPNLDEYDLKFVVYDHAPTHELFPNINVHIHRVPLSWLRPDLLRIIWFHIYCVFYSLFLDRKRVKVSLGIASLFCDVSIIHFIHNQWSPIYFKMTKFTLFKFLYKKILFSYMNLCEKYLFSVLKPKVITVSEFMLTYIKQYFSHEIVGEYIHSGFELDRMGDSGFSQSQVFEKLTKMYPPLSNIDFTQPVSLFIGAFERKGLPIVIEKWCKHSNPGQLIVIGKPEAGSSFKLPEREDIFYIPFSKEVNLFYEISDFFLFPTIYEPFGMVLIEAAVKGLRIISTRENVGALEVLEGFEQIKIFDSSNSFELPKQFKKLSSEEREILIQKRIKDLAQFNWKEVAKKYHHFFERF